MEPLATHGSSPTVTVSMPVYNGSKHIREALDSVVNQTFQDYELLISDNASTDDTGAICEDYCKRYPQIRYFRQSENIGAHGNFNFVTQNAMGALITWLAHDDILEPDFLNETVRVMGEQPKTALVASDFSIVDEFGAHIEYAELTSIRSEVPWEDRIGEFFHYPPSRVLFCIYGLMRSDVGKAVLRNVGQPKMANGSEMPILARIALAGEIVSIPAVLRKYRRHPLCTHVQEAAAVASESVFRRRLIQMMHSNRLRIDQMTVLWASSIPLNLKIKISVATLNYYSRALIARCGFAVR
jgi:glycosyltransferase involved in cell wall biosynthesis